MPAAFLPDAMLALALSSLLFCSAAFASCLALSQSCRRSSVTGVRVVMRARCHSIRSSSSVGMGASSTTSFFFCSASLGGFFFLTASLNSSESSAAASAFFLLAASVLNRSWLACSPPCACLCICCTALLLLLFFMPKVLSATFELDLSLVFLPPAFFCGMTHRVPAEPAALSLQRPLSDAQRRQAQK